MSRFARNVDANQSEVVDAMRRMGAFVQHLHTVGHGCPDLLVGYRGVWILVEVKDGAKVQSKRQLNALEEEWIACARSKRLPVHVVKSVTEAIEVLRFEEGDVL